MRASLRTSVPRVPSLRPLSDVRIRAIDRGSKSYKETKLERGGEEVEKAISKALESRAKGMSLRGACRKWDAPYSSTHDALGKLMENPETWEAFKKSVPASPPKPKDPEIAESGSPLGPRLERRAIRYGDAVPYGHHGPWGFYREGVKEMTTKIDSGKVTPDEASSLLASEGVHVSALVLERKAKKAPGKSPIKAGSRRLISFEREEKIHQEIKFLRKHDIPVTKCTVKAIANSQIKGIRRTRASSRTAP